MLYFRLAWRNLLRNRETYRPFLIASSLLAFALYSFAMIALNPGLAQLDPTHGFSLILSLGIVVVGLLTAIFLFYANSFLIRRRKKELGLYGVLGMEKKHVSRVLFHEMALSWLTAMVFGLGLGMLLARLLFLIVRRLMRLDVPLQNLYSGPALLLVAALFAGLFLLLYWYNAFQVRLSRPVELLRGQQTAEKEPRARWFLAVLGLGCTVAGYVVAQRVNSPLEAVALFFLAVLLVIFGTYLLFLTGSVALLKALRKRKNFYYNSRHFTAVGGMLYRMKQNAAGLASMAILCTMAMITIGTTVALYCGSDSMLDVLYPTDVSVTVFSETDAAEVLDAVHTLDADAGVTVADRCTLRLRDIGALRQGDELLAMDAVGDAAERDLHDDIYAGAVLSQDDYNAAEQRSLALAPDELGWYGADCPARVRIAGKTWRVRQLPAFKADVSRGVGMAFHTLALVAPTDAAAETLAEQLSGRSLLGGRGTVVYDLQWNLNGAQAAQVAYGQRLAQVVADALSAAHPLGDFGYGLSDKASAVADWYVLYGGFLFVGVFLGLVFLMGSALILYFKQVSEGYQDHDRYIILQKVGMSQDEVRRTVRRQILIEFFLPLLVSVCHVGGALHMIVLMLHLFGLTDVPYITLNTFGAALGVAVFYLLFYLRTARTYYRLVRFE